MAPLVVKLEVLDAQPYEDRAALFLREERSSKIGKLEVDGSVGFSINLSLHREQPLRPLPWDLIHHLLIAVEMRLTKVLVTSCKNGIYYTTMTFENSNDPQQHKIIELDARPGDAIALAVRNGVPVHMRSTLWERLPDDKALYEGLCNSPRTGIDTLTS